MSVSSILPSDYGDWLKSLKSRIASARQRAALVVNQELVTLYHSIGRDILQRQANEGWGAKVIQRLSSDLGEAFPDMKGFPPEISITCDFSQNNARISNLCSSLLHNYLGSTLSVC